MIYKIYKLFITYALLLITLNITAQSSYNRQVKNTHIEDVLSLSNTDEKSVDDLVDNLSHKIDINDTNKEELTALLILSPAQVEAIQKYLERVGKIETIYELQLIKELDYDTLQKLIPYVSIPSNYGQLHSNSYHRSKQRYMIRYDQPCYKRKGDVNSFLGNSSYLAIRYNCVYGKHLEWGAVGEKDSGETLLTFKSDKGFDYYSYYLVVNKFYRINRMVLGKYKLHLGNGLVMGGAQYGGKWYAIPSFFGGVQEIKKHASVDEYNYLHGVALSLSFKSFKLLPFLSYRWKDGTIKEDKITGIDQSGLHRNQKEIGKKNTINEWCYGIRMAYQNRKLEVGMNALYYDFNYPINKGTKKYKKYDMEGRSFYNLSLDYLFYFSPFILKGECALGKKGKASLTKLYYSPNADWDLLLIHRFYTPDFWSFYGRSFCNSKQLKNENGWFLSAQTRYFNPIITTFYLDLSSAPWWKYRLSKPSQTIDLGLKIDYSFQKTQRLSLQWRSLFYERDRSESKGRIIDAVNQHKLKLNYECQPLDGYIFKCSSGLHVLNRQLSSLGYHITPRLSWINRNQSLKCDIQYSFFYTQDFDSRVYVFEKGMLYSMNTEALYGKGHRCSIHVSYKYKGWITMLAKYGLTSYLDRGKIGSGLNEVDGHLKSAVQLMAILSI